MSFLLVVGLMWYFAIARARDKAVGFVKSDRGRQVAKFGLKWLWHMLFPRR